MSLRTIENIVVVHIRKLRKIEADPKNPRYLKVVWGLGYKIEKQIFYLGWGIKRGHRILLFRYVFLYLKALCAFSRSFYIFYHF